MDKLTFSTTINAPKDKVWRMMLDDATYRQWTSVFHEGSYAVTDWNEGSKASFLTPEGDGMYSRIAVHRPNDFLSIEHLGVVKKGVEDTASEETKALAGGLENYTIREDDGHSVLTVEMEGMTGEFRNYLQETWPKALRKLKEVVEA